MRKTSWLAAAAVLIGSAACGDDPTEPRPYESAVGVYELLSINGTPMPFPLLIVQNYRLDYTSSLLTMKADSTYVERDITTERIDQQITRVDTSYIAGEWLQEDSAVVLTESEVIFAKLKQGRLTFTLTFQTSQGDSTYAFIYRKQ